MEPGLATQYLHLILIYFSTSVAQSTCQSKFHTIMRRSIAKLFSIASNVRRTQLRAYQFSKRFVHTTNGAKLPLAGIRVIDMSRVLAGPYCTQILGDMGAEIIKVELPERGDETRHWGPPFTSTGHESAYFLCCNRNKKSLTINIKSPKGQSILHDLISKSDILVENFLPNTLKQYNLDYNYLIDPLNNINRSLIYCSITGFGQTGPYSDRGGYDVVIQGMGGLMDITGEEREDSEPCKTGVALIDIITGLYAHGAILAALRSRDNDINNGNNNNNNTPAEPQFIDCSLLDSNVTSLANIGSSYLVSKGTYETKRMGTAHASIVPYQSFKCKDNKWIMIGAASDRLFGQLCEILAGEDKNDEILGFATSDKYKTNAKRVENRKELLKYLQNRFLTKNLDEWVEIFEPYKGFPYGPINDIKRVFDDKHVQSRHLVHNINHTTAGNVDVLGNPVKYSKDSSISDNIQLPPPALGEHTDQILTDYLGFSNQEIKQLRDEGVV